MCDSKPMHPEPHGITTPRSILDHALRLIEQMDPDALDVVSAKVDRQRTVNVLRARRQRISEAIASDQIIRVLYTDQDGVTSARIVFPKKIKSAAGGHEYVVVYDTQRQDVRSFSLARITEVG